MSYQFSFSQAFTGYNFYEINLLTALKSDVQLQKARLLLRIQDFQFVKIRLLTNVDQLQAQVGQILGCFQMMSRYWSAFACLTLVGESCHPPIGRPKISNSQYIQRLRKSLTQTSSDYKSCNIFDRYIVIYLCKYFLKKNGNFHKLKSLWCSILLNL